MSNSEFIYFLLVGHRESALTNAVALVVAVIAIVAMARASALGALRWRRAAIIVLLGSLAILAGSALVVKFYHVRHAANVMDGFIFAMIFDATVALPAWLVVGTLAAIVLTLKSARRLHVNGSPT